jgi:nicotinate phosphoribosyltransferase
MIAREDLPLVTDLYELTMARAYFEHGMLEPATFSLFVRRLPPDRSYLVAAGLEDVLSFLEDLRFSPGALSYLESTGYFTPEFLDFLGRLRFTGEVRAVPEGRICFANEPLLEVTAPIIEGQIAETYLINQVNFQTMIASKAARCLTAARGRTLVDFGLRRAHGVDAGLKAARASYIAGFAATSNLLAGQRYGIPVSGTMAHSFVMAHSEESDAFRRFAETYPHGPVFLIDTYDTLEGARKAIDVAREMRDRGGTLRGVRLDSGNLLTLSRAVREALDNAGFPDVIIIASGSLDEYEIDRLLSAGAPIDVFGVGTKLDVSADHPWLDTAYKLTEYAGRPAMKLSAEKASLPGRKQVFRRYEDGTMSGDILGLAGEDLSGGEPLLETFMSGGKRAAPAQPLGRLRERFHEDYARLPDACRTLVGRADYPVEVSTGLRELASRLASGRAGGL